MRSGYTTCAEECTHNTQSHHATHAHTHKHKHKHIREEYTHYAELCYAIYVDNIRSCRACGSRNRLRVAGKNVRLASYY